MDALRHAITLLPKTAQPEANQPETSQRLGHEPSCPCFKSSKQGIIATCYSCDDGHSPNGNGASFVAELGDQHLVRFLVSDFGISWVESRNGRELVKFEGAEAIQELQRIATSIQERSAMGSTPEIASR